MLQTRLGHVLMTAFAITAGAATAPAEGLRDAEPSALIRDGFETSRTVWNQEQTDTTINLLAHDRSSRAAHEGRTSEHVRFTAGIGSGFFFSYALPKVSVRDELRVGLFVRANRAGVQLYARVILPADVDPETGQPSFLLVPGTTYENVDRWQRLELLEMKPSMERQARVLRATTRRPVSLEGAYVERVVVNMFCGAGETEVYLDELTLGPVTEAQAAAHSGQAFAQAPGAELTPPSTAAPSTNAGNPAGRVRFDRGRLKKLADDGLYHDWFFTAVDAPGADLASLRNAGFDVLIDDADVDPKRFEDAAAKGFLLMPMFGRGGGSLDAERVAEKAGAFPVREAVMAWDLGERLGLAADARERREGVDQVRAAISKLRKLPAGLSRITAGQIDDAFPQFARAPQDLNLLGVRPSAWASSHSVMETYSYLRQRRDLTSRNNAGAFYWAELPAAPPAALPLGVWGHDVPPAWGSPQIQPEQIRLTAYAALSAGYRGLTFRGDAELTRESGRILLLEMALLNAEIDLCESIFANGADPIPLYKGYLPDPSTLPTPGSSRTQKAVTYAEYPPLPGLLAAGIGTKDRKGVLLIVGDYSGTSQYQPGQLARNDLKIICNAPEGAEAFEISPGLVRNLPRERYVGGTRITVPEFDTSALILVTTDIAMAERLEAVVNSIRPRAVQMAIEQAERKLQWVGEVNGRLAADGHYLIEEKERKKRELNGGSISTDQGDLLAKATENIKNARENLEREDYENAWLEARRASRPLRILMAGLWKNAYDAMVRANTPDQDIANEELIKVGRAKRVGVPTLVPPVASAPLASFNTLPQHFLWVDTMKTAHFGANLIPSGTFDRPDALKQAGWTNDSYQYEGIRSSVTTRPNSRDGRRSLLKMTVEPEDPKNVKGLPAFLDFPAAAVRSPAVKVRAGEFFRISVFVQRPTASAAGAGGVVVRDTLGGEPLQFVSAEPIPELTKVVLYRRAAADGELSVTLGLAGYGVVFFDEVSVERVEAESAPAPSAEAAEASGVGRLPRPRGPSAGAPVAAGDDTATRRSR